MLKHLLISITLVFCYFNLAAQDTLQTTIYYGVDQDSTGSKEYAKLDRILKEQEFLKEVILTGHTDSDGSDGYNYDLAKRRVLDVQHYINSKTNVPISADYFGEKKPVAQNINERQKQQNRRVEATFVFHEDTSDYITMEDVYNELSAQTQTFRLRTDQDTILTLEQGTIIKIKANTFSTATNKMVLRVKEVYSYPDMIGERVTTHSNGDLLETGGMINIEATNEANQSIQADKNIAIFMPTDNIQDDMQLFYGEHDAQHDLNWQPKDAVNGGESRFISVVGIPNRLMVMGQIPPIEGDCRFFWCKVRKGLSSVFGIPFEGERYDRQERKLAQQYQDSIQALMDSLGVSNYQELQSKLIEERVNSGNASSRDIGYYAFSTSRLGWINCDRFTNRRPLTAMATDVKANDDNFSALVFQSMKSIFPGRSNGSTISFYNVPEGDPVRHVVVKTYQDKVLLSIVDTKISRMAPKPEFEEIELSELKGRLAKL